jgi:hypothetical protein
LIRILSFRFARAMHPTGVASVPQHDAANVLIACMPFGLDDPVESLHTPFVLHETKKAVRCM